MGARCPLMCRFSDAGDDEALHALRRPASEKRQGTKSRDVSSGGAAGSGCADAMGIWPRGQAAGCVIAAVAATVLAGGSGVVGGVNERRAGCAPSLAVRLPGILAASGKRGRCRLSADTPGEWDGGRRSVTAS